MRVECNLCPSHVCTTSARCPSLDPGLLIPPPLSLSSPGHKFNGQKRGLILLQGCTMYLSWQECPEVWGVPSLYANCGCTSNIALNPNVYN
jgi:hypothetical protein